MADLGFTPTELRHCLKVLSRTLTADAGGGQAEAWSAGSQFFGSIQPVSGRERFRTGSLDASVTHRITCRYRSDLNPTKRIGFGTRVFRIESIQNVEERNIKLVVYVEELGIGG